jgi:hypothetical protein
MTAKIIPPPGNNVFCVPFGTFFIIKFGYNILTFKEWDLAP